MHRRNVSQPKPVRPYRRFIAGKTCDTGHDPVKTLKHFIGRDTIQALHTTRRTITLREDYDSVPRGKVPFGCTKQTFKLGLTSDAKMDRESLGFSTQ